MRMNRGTIALVVVGIIVIIGVLVINNNQANTPDATPTASQIAGGPLFLGVTADMLVRFEVRDNTTGARTVLARSGEDLWELAETGAPAVTDEPTDEATLEPTAEATEAASATSEATAEATDEATPEATPAVESATGQTIDQETVQTNLTALLGLNAADRFESDQLADFGLDRPAYSIFVTSEDGTEYVIHIGGDNPTGNRYYAVQEQLSGAEATSETGSGTEEPAADATNEADDEATPEATEAIDSTSAEATEPASATSEATAEGTPEATTDLEPLATAALAPLPEPLVVLQGTRLIQTIPKTQIDQLIAFITTPPYFIPTPVPTLPIPLPENTVEATQATPEATERATEEATEQATPEATIEATAEATSES